MPKKLATEVDIAVRKLSGESFSHRDIVKQLKLLGTEISRRTVGNLLSFTGFRRNHKSIGLTSPKGDHKPHPMPVRTKQLIRKVGALTNKENPPSQGQMTKKFHVSQRTIQNIIRKDLE